MSAAKWSLLTALALVLAITGWLLVQQSSHPPGLAPGEGAGVPTSSIEHVPAPPDEIPAERSVVDAGTAVRESPVAWVTGRVLDPYGDAVPGALVGESGAAEPVACAADGSFSYGVEGGPRSLSLLVLADGFAPNFVDVDAFAAGEHHLGEVELLRGGELRGIVVDADGRGIAAEVELQPLGWWPSTLDSGLLHPPVASAGGHFSFAQLAPGTYRVRAHAQGRPQVRTPMLRVLDDAVTDVEPLVLPSGHRLEGRVLGPGDEPVAAATVAARASGGGVEYASSVASLADGRFVFDDVPAAPLTISVTKAGLQACELRGIDATTGKELFVRLLDGLTISGVVVDEASGRPVERFAVSARRIGDVEPRQHGTIEQQLKQSIEALRREAAAGDAPEATVKLRLADELAARLARLRQQSAAMPAAAFDVGDIASHAGGMFAIDGLAEGLYTVAVASPAHQFAEQRSIALARGAPAPELRFRLAAGRGISGVATARADGRPVAGARADLVRLADGAPADANTQGLQRSLAPWLFAANAPNGVVLMTASTDGEGRFSFQNAGPGLYVVSVRHTRFSDYHSAPFTLANEAHELRCPLEGRAALHGRVTNAPAVSASACSVLVVGGHGELRTVRAVADGTYRCDGLQPGSYMVRAFPTGDEQFVRRLFGEWFPLHAGALDPDRLPPRDLTLAAGETRRFDLAVELPPSGSVAGAVHVNGRPGAQCTVALHPVRAPGSGGLTLRKSCDANGDFAFASVPLGTYELAVRGHTRQELHREEVSVSAEGALRRLDLVAGSARGRIRAVDGTPPEELRGNVWVLPGADEVPADLHEYRKQHRVHRLQVRDGAFEDAMLTPGPAVVIVDLRNRAPWADRIVVPAGSEITCELHGGR